MDLFIFLEKSGDYLADNPIEKRPNYGFHLDMRCLALACANCNIRCLNCQNHDIPLFRLFEQAFGIASAQFYCGVTTEVGIAGIVGHTVT